MGKHNKPRNVGRTALVIGAAPIAMLIANATSAGATTTDNPLGIPGGTLTSHLNHGSEQSTNSATGVSSSKEFVDGFLAAKNAQHKTVPLGDNSTATAAQSAKAENGMKTIHEAKIGPNSAKSSDYARGYTAGTLDHSFVANYGDVVAAHQDRTTTRGDVHADSDSSVARNGAAHATGQQTGSVHGTTSRNETFGDGDHYVNSGSSNAVTGSTHGGHTLAVDPKTGSADIAKSMRNALAGTTDNYTTAQYNKNSVATTRQGAFAANTNSTDSAHADKDGNLLVSAARNGTISGTHAIGAASAAGDFYHGTLGDVTTVNGETTGERGLAFSPLSGVLSNGELASDQRVDHVYGGALALGPLDGNLASKQSVTMVNSVRNVSGMTPAQQSDTVTAVDRAVAASDDSTAGLGVEKVVGVQLSGKTEGAYTGSSTVTTHNGAVDKPENTSSYGLKHSANLHLRLGEQSQDEGVDIAVPPLSITPHSG